MDNILRIINYLGKNDQSFTMHNLSSILKIPYATFYRTVSRMKDLLIIKPVGKAKIISLAGNPIISSYLAVSSFEEKNDYLKHNKLISLLSKELSNDIILLFGSYADNSFSDKSDIDLLVINKKGNKSFSSSSFELLHKKKVNAIFIKESEFKAMLRKPDENVGKQAKINHIILNNPSSFWEIAWKSTRNHSKNS
ncbi:nucleotidyltransferase domain-containing protein [Candidatus Woesearchaeota archaeon]|nr:nucleotidyltransferase domain-containing protein [Candidatus Woesearchaeota archaeon]